MRRLPILLLVAMSQAAFAGGPTAEAVDPALWAAASTGGFRALVVRECSPEHCWTRLYVQVEKRESNPTQFQCTAEVKELGYGSFVTDVVWKPLPEAALVAKVSPSHGGFEPYEATITVANDCGYKVVPSRPAV